VMLLSGFRMQTKHRVYATNAQDSTMLDVLSNVSNQASVPANNNVSTFF